MANWYIRKSGSDSNGGTSPSNAWLTLTKALDSATPIASGDTVWIGAGVYRETVFSGKDFTSETFFKADVTGVNTGDAGEVIFSMWLIDEFTNPSDTDPCLRPGNFQTYEDIRFESYDWRAIDLAVNLGGAHDVTFRRCTITSFNGGPAVEVWVKANVPSNFLMDQCLVFGYGDVFLIQAYYHTANYDIGITIRNSIIIAWGAGPGITIRPVGSVLAGKFGGGKVLQSLILGARNGGIWINLNDYNTGNKLVVRGCQIIAESGITSDAANQIDENYNVITSWTARSNVSSGANSLSGVPPVINSFTWNFGHEQLTKRLIPRPYWAPRDGSLLLGFHAAGSYTGEQSVDMLNRPRPAGAPNLNYAGSSLNYAVGPLERHDTGQMEIAVVDPAAGPASIVLVGPADHDIRVPVPASAVTITIRGRFDTTHGTTTRPQVTRLANTEIGVTATTVTMTVAADTWETLTIGPFTPTAIGIVTLRLLSRPAAAGGKAYFDTVTIT